MAGGEAACVAVEIFVAIKLSASIFARGGTTACGGMTVQKHLAQNNKASFRTSIIQKCHSMSYLGSD